jgi:hypothetical protein
MPQAMKARIMFDAIGITIIGGLGFRLLLSFVTHEGLANVRMHTELALAHGIQARLVPDISFQMPRFEVYGKSISSTEMRSPSSTFQSFYLRRRITYCELTDPILRF